MRTARSRKLAALVATLALLVAACGDDPAPSTPSEPGTPSQPGTPSEPGTPTEPGGDVPDTLVISPRGDITNTDMTRRASLEDYAILFNVYDQHVRRNSDGTVGPGLIESWESSDDLLVWTLNLRQGVLFHNGEEMKAEDVAWSIERSGSLGVAVSSYWQNVAEAEIVDDYTVRLHLNTPNALTMQSGELTVIPKAYFEEVGEQGFEAAPIGAGPYKFVEWRPDQHLILEAFEDYWDGEPPIKNVIFRSIPDDAARAAAYRAGEIDIAVNLQLQDFQAMEGDPNFKTIASFGALRNFIVLDSQRPPFDDVRVRKALNHAINWDLIIEQILEGFAERTPVVAIPEEVAFDPTLEPYAYDPDLARQLMAEAGYPDGVDVEFTVRGAITRGDEVTSAIQAQIADIGIRASITNVSASEYGPLSAAKQIGQMAWTGFVGDGAFVGQQFYTQRTVCGPTMSSVHGGFYCNDEVMQPLIDEALTYFASDFDRAQQALRQLERECYEDACYGFAYREPRLYGVNPALNWEPSPFDYQLMRTASW